MTFVGGLGVGYRSIRWVCYSGAFEVSDLPFLKKMHLSVRIYCLLGMIQLRVEVIFRRVQPFRPLAGFGFLVSWMTSTIELAAKIIVVAFKWKKVEGIPAKVSMNPVTRLVTVAFHIPYWGRIVRFRVVKVPCSIGGESSPELQPWV